MKFKEIKRRGQAMVLWALLTPLLIVFVGVGMDLGWYYLTVSRLQNAADAAVLAGAWKLVEKNQDLSDYYVYSLTGRPTEDFKPDSNGDYTLYYIDEETQVYSSKTINEKPGKTDAMKYANKNLSDTEKTNKVSDSWNTIEKNNGVTFQSALYARKADIDRKENGVKYYKVTLTEKVSHLFLRGFKPMEAKVVAYALLKPHDLDLVTIINQLEKKEIIANWEYQNKYHNFMGNWNHYRQTIGNKKAVAYKDGDDFRTETVNVQIAIGNTTTNTNTSSGQTTSANGGKYFSETQVDSLNIDFNQDVQFNTPFSNADWDLRGWSTDNPPATISYVGAAQNGWNTSHGYDLRVQGLINFKDAWRNRNLLDNDPSNNLEPDPLWVRIEGDPFWSDGRSNNQKQLDSVRQFIINAHVDNTTVVDENGKSPSLDASDNRIKDADGNPQYVYKYRPFFIFYMGPEINDKNAFEQSLNKTFAEDTFARKSQPVIINLYADWNAILYMPYSPVIINGNGHKLTGFVIAKEYLWCTEAEDYTDNGYRAVTDSYGHTLFVKQSDLDNKTNGIVTELPSGSASYDYRKITYTKDDKEEILYIKEETTAEYNARRKANQSSNKPYAQYYMEVVPGGSEGKDSNGNTVQNKIIIDNKGDLQTKPKPLSDSSYGLTRPTKNPEEQPDDYEFQKKLHNLSSGELQDYRILDLEVVYKKKDAFNLSEDSYYSYFQIPALKREVYTYLNVDEVNGTTEYKLGKSQVDDMFFTTKRASWID